VTIKDLVSGVESRDQCDILINGEYIERSIGDAHR
jgi:archaellum component FlaF (FlaF/FlaG flagellin family)